MEITIRVIPRAKKSFIKELEDGGLKVYLHAPAVEGKANKALIDILASHFQVRKRQIEITKGLKSRNKMIRIIDILTCRKI